MQMIVERSLWDASYEQVMDVPESAELLGVSTRSDGSIRLGFLVGHTISVVRAMTFRVFPTDYYQDDLPEGSKYVGSVNTPQGTRYVFHVR